MTYIAHFLLSSLFLIIGGGAVCLLFRFVGSRSPLIHRTAWGAVLLLGVLWFKVPMAIPVWMEAPPSQEVLPIQVATTEANTDVPAPLISTDNAGEWHHAYPSSLNVSNEQVAIPEAAVEKTAVVFTPPSVVAILFTLWLAGIAWFAGYGGVAWLRTRRRLRETTSPEGIFKAEWESLLAKLRISPHKVRLVIADQSGPRLVRLLGHYVVVVPRTMWEETSAAVRRGILKHELSHYAHGDLATSFVLRLIALLHWFNPMAAYAVRRFEEATEWRCDAEAFGRYEDGTSDFARAMLAFRDTVPVVATYQRDFCSNNLKERAERLVETSQQLGDSLMKKTMMTSCILLLLCSGLFRVEFVEKTAAQEAPNESRERNAVERPDVTPDSADTVVCPPVLLDIVELSDVISTAEPFAVPDGTPEELLQLIRQKSRGGIAVPVKKEEIAPYVTFFREIKAIADQGLTRQPTDAVRKEFLQMKAHAYGNIAHYEPEVYSEYEAFVREVEANPNDRETAMHIRGRFLEFHGNKFWKNAFTEKEFLDHRKSVLEFLDNKEAEP